MKDQSSHIKVLHITEWFPHEGDLQLGGFIQKQIKALSPSVDQMVVAILPGKNSVSFTDEGYCQMVKFKNSDNLWGKIHFLSSIRKVYKELKRFNPDVIHVHAASRKALILASFFHRTPLVISEHWSGYLRNPDEVQLKQRISWLSKANAIIAVSNHLAEAIKTIVPDVECYIVPNVIMQGKVVYKQPGKRALMVADMDDDNKRISSVVKAFQQIRPEGWILQIIGDGPDRLRIEAEVKSDQIDLIGRLDNDQTLEYIAEADFLIVNSRVETFSMVTCEALLSGVPVLATRCGGPELFMDHQSGILMPIENETILADAIRQMIGDHTSMDTSGAAKRISSACSPESVQRGILEVYQSVLHG